MTKTTSLLELISETVEQCGAQNRMANVIPTGWPDLDSLINGLQRGEVLLVAAGHATGKTSFGLQLSSQIPDQQVLFFANRLTQQQLALRLLAIKSAQSITKISSGELSEEGWGVLSNTIGELNQGMLSILTPEPYCLTRIAIDSARAASPRVLIIDDFERLLPSAQLSLTKEILQGLRVIARELDLAVVLLCKLAVSLDKRSDPRPVLSDLAPLGLPVDMFDKIIFLHRNDCYAHLPPDFGMTGVFIAYQRDGKQNTRFNLCFSRDSLRFESIA